MKVSKTRNAGSTELRLWGGWGDHCELSLKALLLAHQMRFGMVAEPAVDASQQDRSEVRGCEVVYGTYCIGRCR